MREKAPAISDWMLGAFARYTRWYLRRHFHAVRLLKTSPLAFAPGRPIIIYLNHPSWWDPLVCLFLARYLMPDRQHYAPIDSRAFARYGFFSRLGFYAVEQDTSRGARQFLRVSRRILQSPSSVIWVTGQGQFTDVRRRPIVLKAGLSHLLAGGVAVAIVPFALEYCFWTERTPEALVAFGATLDGSQSLSAAQWQETLESTLAETSDALASASVLRRPEHFTSILEGNSGVARMYDLWRRARAFALRKPYIAEHGNELA